MATHQAKKKALDSTNEAFKLGEIFATKTVPGKSTESKTLSLFLRSSVSSSPSTSLEES